MNQEAFNLLQPISINSQVYNLSEQQIDTIFGSVYNYALNNMPDLGSRFSVVDFNNYTCFGDMMACENLFYNPQRAVQGIQKLIPILDKNNPGFLDIYRSALKRLNGSLSFRTFCKDDNAHMWRLIYKALAEIGSVMFTVAYGYSEAQHDQYHPLDQTIKANIRDSLSIEHNENPPEELNEEEKKICDHASQAIYTLFQEHKNEWCNDDDRYDQYFSWSHCLSSQNWCFNYKKYCHIKDDGEIALHDKEGLWIYIKYLMNKGLLLILETEFPSIIHQQPKQGPQDEWYQKAVTQLIEEDDVNKASTYFRLFHFGKGNIPFDYPLNSNESKQMMIDAHSYDHYKPKFLLELRDYLIKKGMPSYYVLEEKDVTILQQDNLDSDQIKIIADLFDPTIIKDKGWCISQYNFIRAGVERIEEEAHIKDMICGGPLFVKAKSVTLEGVIDAAQGAVIVAEKFNFKNIKLWQVAPCYLIQVLKINLEKSTKICAN